VVVLSVVVVAADEPPHRTTLTHRRAWAGAQRANTLIGISILIEDGGSRKFFAKMDGGYRLKILYQINVGAEYEIRALSCFLRKVSVDLTYGDTEFPSGQGGRM